MCRATASYSPVTDSSLNVTNPSQSSPIKVGYTIFGNCLPPCIELEWLASHLQRHIRQHVTDDNFVQCPCNCFLRQRHSNKYIVNNDDDNDDNDDNNKRRYWYHRHIEWSGWSRTHLQQWQSVVEWRERRSWQSVPLHDDSPLTCLAIALLQSPPVRLRWAKLTYSKLRSYAETSMSPGVSDYREVLTSDNLWQLLGCVSC